MSNSLLRSFVRILIESNLDVKTLNSYVQDSRMIDPIKRLELSKFVQTQSLPNIHLERISSSDPDWNVGDVVKFDVSSFTTIHVSQGKKAGHIAWKSSDKALIVIENATKGYAIDYDLVTVWFSASEEKEILVSGQYRVTDKKMITEPGTNPDYGYKTPCYFLSEI